MSTGNLVSSPQPTILPTFHHHLFPSVCGWGRMPQRAGFGCVPGTPVVSLRVHQSHTAEQQYVTFVNLRLPEEAAIFARIAVELNHGRPHIPLLVVEGRGTSDAMARLPVDFSGLTNLHRKASTHDPGCLPREPGGTGAVL